MTNFDHGRAAEAAAVALLAKKGCTILDQNWRTRSCEIDIVAQKSDTVYLCEVKYRRSASQGSGVEYITPKKLHQMQFAAETWVHVHNWSGDFHLCAIEVAGPDYVVTQVIVDP